MRSVGNWLLSRPRAVMFALVAILMVSLMVVPNVVEAQLAGSGCAGVTYGCTSGELPTLPDYPALTDAQSDALMVMIFWNLVIIGFILTGVPVI